MVCNKQLYLYSYKMCKSTGIWLQTKSWDKQVTACVCTDVLIFFEIAQSFPTALSYWPLFCWFQISPNQTQSINKGLLQNFLYYTRTHSNWLSFTSNECIDLKIGTLCNIYF